MTVSITFTGETEADIRRQAAEFGSETAQRALQQVDQLTLEVRMHKTASANTAESAARLRSEVARLKAEPALDWMGWNGWRSPDSGKVDVSDDKWIVALGKDNQISPPMRAKVLLYPGFRESIRAFAEVPKPKGWWRP